MVFLKYMNDSISFYKDIDQYDYNNKNVFLA